MWKLISKPATQKVTKKLAKEFAEMDPAPHDRPLSERRLQVYQRLLKDGAFRPVTWAKAICDQTNGLYRVNGKHTSIMLSGLDEMPEFYVTIEEYQCDTLEDVARLYATFDSKMQSRTARDIYASFAATVPELAALPVSTINVCVAGINLHLSGGSPNHKATAAEKAELLLEYPDFSVWVHGIISTRSDYDRADKGYKKINRGPVVGAMFATWLKSKTAATEFWTAVRDETGPSPKSPDRVLARYLATSSVEWSVGVRNVRSASSREFYVKSLHAWNAWRKGEDTNLRYYAEKPVPSIR